MASIALAFNLIMVLAVMVLIKGAFTLPGLAGLVLTVGMSVDTNVLIYERIREELESGAALRMAIRNGFGRAMSAIIDSNLTTIISGIVLYSIGHRPGEGLCRDLDSGHPCEPVHGDLLHAAHVRRRRAARLDHAAQDDAAAFRSRISIS